MNDSPVNIPSYLVKAGDVIAVRENPEARPYYRSSFELAQQVGMPAWVEVDAYRLRAFSRRCRIATNLVQISTNR